MPPNKYELRSNEVQEVMNKPPHSLITWGNTIILLTIVGGLWLFSLITFPDKITVPFQLIISENKLSLSISGNLPAQIQPQQTVSLSFESYPNETYGKVTTAIDSLINQHTITLTRISDTVLTTYKKTITLKNNMLGTAEIIIGKKNLFTMIKNRFNGD